MATDKNVRGRLGVGGSVQRRSWSLCEPTFPGFPGGTTSGSYHATLDSDLASTFRAGWITDAGGTVAQAEAELFTGISTGRAYLNIHTYNFPGGEIRGFLVPLPELSSCAMAALGLLALTAVARRRNVRAS
jgi:hypothetical protein